MENDYYKWKAGKKVFKAPWVIDHYKSITDENQYDKSRVVQNRLLLILGTSMFIAGFYFGWLVFG